MSHPSRLPLQAVITIYVQLPAADICYMLHVLYMLDVLSSTCYICYIIPGIKLHKALLVNHTGII